ncbi:MAG: phosphatase PAP2 family protein [Vicinamibacterales bacterium]|nr:phosphatase PAP2 family protein [Vicinamibacterales bacterium]
MSARSMPLLVAAAVTVVVGAAAAFLPSLPGDVAVARVIQSIVPNGGWVPAVITTAYAPQKLVLMLLAVVAAFYFGGVRGALVLVIAIAVEQSFGEGSKQLFTRPRPSPELIAVTGSPSGFSFPSTFVTLYSVTFGGVLLIAARAARSTARTAVLGVCAAALVVAGLARVVPGAHWPSDVLGTYAICLTWLHAALVMGRR